MWPRMWKQLIHDRLGVDIEKGIKIKDGTPIFLVDCDKVFFFTLRGSQRGQV